MIRNICHQRNNQLALLCAAMVLFSFAPWHHGWSSYDQTKTLKFNAKIIEMAYENPHGMIKIEVEKKKWTVVLAPPSRMESRGLTRDMLKVGTSVAVVGYPHIKIKDEMRAERVTVGDKTIELR
ncbi:MAG TPA: DUF6152 family protein [Chryseolinea sp.]|nr:DUF6152 family protein [Chryseolinea sp.]